MMSLKENFPKRWLNFHLSLPFILVGLYHVDLLLIRILCENREICSFGHQSIGLLVNISGKPLILYSLDQWSKLVICL